MVNVIHVDSWDEACKARNMEWHVREVELAAAHLKRWPCITTISNMRLALEAMERDIKAGDA